MVYCVLRIMNQVGGIFACEYNFNQAKMIQVYLHTILKYGACCCMLEKLPSQMAMLHMCMAVFTFTTQNYHHFLGSVERAFVLQDKPKLKS